MYRRVKITGEDKAPSYTVVKDWRQKYRSISTRGIPLRPPLRKLQKARQFSWP